MTFHKHRLIAQVMRYNTYTHLLPLNVISVVVIVVRVDVVFVFVAAQLLLLFLFWCCFDCSCYGLVINVFVP